MEHFIRKLARLSVKFVKVLRWITKINFAFIILLAICVIELVGHTLGWTSTSESSDSTHTINTCVLTIGLVYKVYRQSVYRRRTALAVLLSLDAIWGMYRSLEGQQLGLNVLIIIDLVWIVSLLALRYGKATKSMQGPIRIIND
jgi:hypothetical protein